MRPGAICEVIEGAGHISMIERPVAFAAALERVLTAIACAAGAPAHDAAARRPAARLSRDRARDGALVVYLHGAIGSPQSVCPELQATVEGLGVRYVMVSRPGFGGSDPVPGRTLASFAGDVAQLADALDRARFAVVGVSAGGPYALACAHELPRRVAVAGVVSCMMGVLWPAEHRV